MMTAVQAIQDANKEIHRTELSDVMPVTSMGGPDTHPSSLPPPPQGVQISMPLHQHQHHQQQQSSPHQSHLHQLQTQNHLTQSLQNQHDHHHHHHQQLKSDHDQLHHQHIQPLQPPLTPGLPQQQSKHLQSQGMVTDNCSEGSGDIATTSQRAHACSTCLKGFRSKQQLAQHSLVHSNVRKYSCTYCERAFKQLSHLQQHTRIHTGKETEEKNEERKYKCLYCERAFKQLTHLQQHTRLHTGEKPYSCKFEGCDRAFAQLSNLQHHMRNHEDQVKKEASRIHKCVICHRSYTNESSLRAHTLKMHVHIKQLSQDGPNPEGAPVKKRRRKKQNLYAAPTMVPISSHDNAEDVDRPSSSIRTSRKLSESSSDDDLIIIGEKNKDSDESRIGNMSRSLVESLNHYERTLVASMAGGGVLRGVGGDDGGRNVQDSNISSSNQFAGQHQANHGGNGEHRGNRYDLGRPSALGLHSLMGLSGMDPSILSNQHPEMLERAAAAAAAAVSNQLHNLSNRNNTINSNSDGGMSGNHGNHSHSQASHSQHGHKSGGGSNNNDITPTSTPTPTPPLHPLDMVGMGGGQYNSQNPYMSASQIMEAHIRSQLPPMGLSVMHDQYPAHSGAQLSSVGSLSHHARFLGPRSMADLSMSYGSQLSTASSLHSSASSNHMSLSNIQPGGSRPPSVIGSPQHVSESLNFSS